MRIVCENLSFSYNPSKRKGQQSGYALQGLSLTVEEGEFFGIIGQTGSGKSTLIQHLNALIPLQEGVLRVGDFDLDPSAKGYKKQLKGLRSKVGLVFQYPEYQLFADTVYEDVAFGVKNFYPELSDEEVRRRVGDAITAVGLNYNEVKDKSPFDLSGGQKRRVAIAGVIATEPEILVLDEPVAGLDPAGKRELMGLLHSLLVGNRTIIIVSHDMDEVCENCSRIAVMQDGRIVSVGTPEEVFASQENVKRLALPVTARLLRAVNGVDGQFQAPLKCEPFIEGVVEFYNAKKSKNSPYKSINGQNGLKGGEDGNA